MMMHTKMSAVVAKPQLKVSKFGTNAAATTPMRLRQCRRSSVLYSGRSDTRKGLRGLSAVVRASGGEGSGEDGEISSPSWMKRVGAGAVAFATAATLTLAPGAMAGIDPRAAATGQCLLSSCQLELAGCLADEKCAESLVCLQTCFGGALHVESS
jgi:hypothetical protein